MKWDRSVVKDIVCQIQTKVILQALNTLTACIYMNDFDMHATLYTSESYSIF